MDYNKILKIWKNNNKNNISLDKKFSKWLKKDKNNVPDLDVFTYQLLAKNAKSLNMI